MDESDSPSIYQTLTLTPCQWLQQESEQLRKTTPSIIQQFSLKYDVFMFGPSFAREFRAAIQRSYMWAPFLVQDTYASIFIAIKGGRHDTGLWGRLLMDQGTISLRRLRTARITRMQDAFVVLALGQTVAAFDLLTHCMGLNAIMRYSLSSIGPWYGELSRDPALDPITITPILCDTISCLVRREVPVIKYSPRDAHVVDRMAGLSTTLLPIFYDLCVASKMLKHQLQSGPQVDTSAITQIEQRLLSWSPEPPPDLTDRFSKQEIHAMHAQALMYRTAGLLIAHRMMNPIGTLDDTASCYANSIILDFMSCSTSLGPGESLHNVAFPILVAALEIPTVPSEIWKSIKLLAIAPACVTKILDLVDHVWLKRRLGSMSFLLDLVEDGPDLVILP
jgi:hypothetical protein